MPPAGYRICQEIFAGCAALILLVVIAVYSGLDLVPSWEAARPATMSVLALLAFAASTTCFFIMPKGRQSLLQRSIMTGLSGLAIVFWLAIVSLDFSLLGGSYLQASFHSPSSNRSLFVYEESSIPDGFERTYLMERDGFLPIMHEIYSAPYRLQSIQQVATGPEIVFSVYHRSKEHAIRENAIALYDLQSGSLDLDEMPPEWRLSSEL